MLSFRLYFFLFLLQASVFAQCPVADFTMATTACKSQNLQMQNATTGASQYEWDFCAGDFALTPTATIIATSSLLNRTRNMRIIQEAGNWYGFTIDQTSNKLIRFEFGSSLASVPTVTDMGNPSSALNGAYDFRMHKQDGIWYALVVNTAASTLLRLSFNGGLQAAPAVLNYGSFGGALSTPNGLFLATDNGTLLAFVSNGGTAEIVRVNFGTPGSILNTPTTASFAVTGGSNLRGIAIIRECGKWFGLVTSYSNAKVFWLDFASGLQAAPSTGELTIAFTPTASYNFPASVVINEDGGEYYAFIQSAVGPLYRISFGQSIVDKAGTATSLGNLGLSSENFAQEWVRSGSDWYGFSIDLTNKRLARITLPTTCDASVTNSTAANPLIYYTGSGVRKVVLRAFNASGGVAAVSKTVTVGTNTAPDISFGSANICANNDVNFISQNTSGNITNYDWDFGDLTAHGTVPNPVHVFATQGQYTVNLKVTASNGCENTISNGLKIYTAPVAAFTVPPGLICTNNEITFTNNTADNYDGNLVYQWSVDGDPAGNSRDLQYTFTDTGVKNVKLEMEIPGCADNITHATSNVQAGPVVDFSYLGNCETEQVDFTSNISEVVPTYAWDFKDGGTSAAPNPQHTFASAGTYQVSLTATSTGGCNNTTSMAVVISSKPAVDFEVAPPPQSCSGSATQFIDLTPDPSDSDVISWHWDFNDGTGSISSEQHPKYTYALASAYQVNLLATTNAGCSRAVQKFVTIAPSPVVTIANGTACKGLPVNFTGTGSNIKSYYWEMGTSYYEVANPAHTFNNTGGQLVKVTIAGNNNCELVINKIVTIPVPLDADFSAMKYCVGSEGVYTDITTGADAVVHRAWDFGAGNTRTGSPALFTHSATGSKNVKLTVTGGSGCSYAKTKTVVVGPAPLAQFTASPETGAAPMQVQFTNTSTGATQYLWSFGDGATSTQGSPIHTFTEQGEFATTLTATSSEGCESTLGKTFGTTVAMPDVDLKVITASTNADGTLKMIITIQNKGNTMLRDLPVYIDVSGDVLLREIVPGPIAPSSQYNLVLGYGIGRPAEVRFVCALAELAGDLAPEGNRICRDLNQETSFLTTYPNPARAGTLNVEWVASEDQQVSIMLTDIFGKRVIQTDISSTAGLNRRVLDVSGFESGIYLLIVSDGRISRVQRVFIAPEN